MLIPHWHSIGSEVEEQPLVTFNTVQMRRDRHMRNLVKSAPFPREKYKDSSSSKKLALYATSCSDALSRSGVRASLEGSGKATLVRLDPVLAYITAQRAKLGLQTSPMKNPDVLEADRFRESVVATSAPVTGIKDLQMLSKKLQLEPKASVNAAIASDFVYALRGNSSVNVCFNMFDLRIVSSEKARKHSTYYTISAFSIAQVRKRPDGVCC